MSESVEEKLQSRMLSAKELVEGYAKNANRTLPKRGQKTTFPTGSWREEEEIDRRLQEQKALLAAQRIEKKCMRSVAEWKEDKGLAMVTFRKGKQWSTFGFEKDKNLWLLPEEALYLLEINILDLQLEGATMSVQQAYTLILTNHLTLTTYRVYTKLQRLGWVVRRPKERPQAPPTSTTTAPPLTTPSSPVLPNSEVEFIDLEDEDKFNPFDQYVPNVLQKSQFVVRVAPKNLLPPNAVPVRKEYTLRFGGAGPPPLLHTPPQQQQAQFFPAGNNTFSRPRNAFNNPVVNNFHQRYVNPQRFFFQMQQTHYRGSFFQAQRFEFQVGNYSPQNNYGQLFRQRGALSSPRRPPFDPRHRHKQRPRDEIPHYEKAPPSSTPSTPGAKKGSARSWSELKAKEGAIETITLEGADDPLDQNGLLQPKDCKTYGSVLKKLRIFKEGVASSKKIPKNLQVKFEVFLPSNSFRKSNPPTPKYQVIILNHSEKVPSEVEMQLVEGQVTKGSLALFALVHPDCIQFLSLNKVELDMTL